MEILEEFDFDHRESRSQWARYVDKLADDGVAAIKLTVGTDIDEATGLENAHTGLSTYARDRRGRSARVRKFPDAKPPYLVVGLRPKGEEPKRQRRRRTTNRQAGVTA